MASTTTPSTSDDKKIANGVKCVFGTMTFSRPPNFYEQSLAQVEQFVAAGHNELDTAIMYGVAVGESERYIGRMLKTPLKDKVLVSTKANPFNFDHGLNAKSIATQSAHSHANLGIDQVDIYYLHMPDSSTPIEQTLKAVDDLHKAGKFKRFGLSNYAAWQVTEIVYLCKTHGWVLPTVYQGTYSLLARTAEPELFPVLRRFGISFYAYSPLAGGLLTGKYKFENKDEKNKPEGRFFAGEGGNQALSGMFFAMNWKKEKFMALEKFEQALKDEYGTDEKTVVSPPNAALRWLLHHSKLSGAHGDAIIIGATSASQLATNLLPWNAAGGHHGPLAPKVVAAMEATWELASFVARPYFSSFDGVVPPFIHALYDAPKKEPAPKLE